MKTKMPRIVQSQSKDGSQTFCRFDILIHSSYNKFSESYVDGFNFSEESVHLIINKFRHVINLPINKKVSISAPSFFIDYIYQLRLDCLSNFSFESQSRFKIMKSKKRDVITFLDKDDIGYLDKNEVLKLNNEDKTPEHSWYVFPFAVKGSSSDMAHVIRNVNTLLNNRLALKDLSEFVFDIVGFSVKDTFGPKATVTIVPPGADLTQMILLSRKPRVKETLK